jgi:hypothetical protein
VDLYIHSPIRLHGAYTSKLIAGHYVPCGAWILSYHYMPFNGLVRNGVTRIKFVIMEIFTIVLESKNVMRNS